CPRIAPRRCIAVRRATFYLQSQIVHPPTRTPFPPFPQPQNHERSAATRRLRFHVPTPNIPVHRTTLPGAKSRHLHRSEIRKIRCCAAFGEVRVKGASITSVYVSDAR
ncbi:hypothetical protein C8R43DRAFT_1236326, partial [Mycena crocata]